MDWVDFCPNCESKLDDYEQAEGKDKKPETDDYTICLYCVQPLVFADDVGHVRYPTKSELVDMLLDERVARVIAGIMLFKSLEEE